MPKHGRKNMGKYIRGNVDEALPLGTLSGKAVVAIVFDEVMVEGGRITSVVGSYAMEGFTPTAGDGPIRVGLAHSDYTAAEIEEFIENAGSWDPGNKISQEINSRRIREVGVFSSEGQGVAAVGGPVTLNDGKPIKTKLNWYLTTGDTLDLWAYNSGGGNLTTGAEVHLSGHANIFLD